MEANQAVDPREPHRTSKTLMEILAVSFKLGVTSFGGPIAHLGYFHKEYINKRRWMDEQSYAGLVALCQFLPGPASSQVGISIGVIRGGLLGGLIAWVGFTLPSLIIMVLFAFLLQGLDFSNAGWIHGLKIVAVAIVAQAILGMGQKLTPDKRRVTLAIIVASVTLIWQTMFTQVLLIAAAGLFGLWMYRRTISSPEASELSVPISRTLAVGSLAFFIGLLVALPLLRQIMDNGWLSLFDSFYRSGSLVFGGGHVVLPLLEREVVPTGWVSQADFLAGYGATQAVPGPLFTFAAYLGAMTKGIMGAIVATIAIFLPAFLLVIGTLPFWNSLRKSPQVLGALIGINAAVVGILLAALYNPLWTTAIMAPADFALLSILFIMLVFWKLPPWVVVIAGIVGGLIISYF
jgi:chromate transporter